LEEGLTNTMEINKVIYKTLHRKKDYLLIDCCLTSGSTIHMTKTRLQRIHHAGKMWHWNEPLDTRLD